MEKKKETRDQLERKIRRALVFVPRDKDYKSIYFSDKGLRLEITQDSCVISTGYHKHVFSAINAGGYNRGYIYTKRFIEIALENIDAITIRDVVANEPYYSYSRLFDLLKNNKEKSNDYAIAFFCDMWFYNIFNPLYEIGESESAQFFTFLHYVENVARNSVILQEKKDDVTNIEILDSFVSKVKELMSGIGSRVIYKKETDKELAENEMKAVGEFEDEKILKAKTDIEDDSKIQKAE